MKMHASEIGTRWLRSGIKNIAVLAIFYCGCNQSNLSTLRIMNVITHNKGMNYFLDSQIIGLKFR